MQPSIAPPSNHRMAFTREEAAQTLGVCVRTIDALIADPESKFPVARIGRKVLIPVHALEDWLTRRTQINGEV